MIFHASIADVDPDALESRRARGRMRVEQHAAAARQPDPDPVAPGGESPRPGYALRGGKLGVTSRGTMELTRRKDLLRGYGTRLR